ncbi:MAG: hypothetical protein HUJ31_19670 [Pseudomonadales bacterium]|nr:hypothetical protein [Pseudomonadales bacterium]
MGTGSNTIVGAILGILVAMLFDKYVLDGDAVLWRVIIVTVSGAVLGVVLFKMGAIAAEILNTDASGEEDDRQE